MRQAAAGDDPRDDAEFEVISSGTCYSPDDMSPEIRCRRCNEPVSFGPFRTESLTQFRQFMVVTLVISLIALGLQLLGVSLWPMVLYGISAFVLMQALLKLHASRWVMCRGCGDCYSHYGRRERARH